MGFPCQKSLVTSRACAGALTLLLSGSVAEGAMLNRWSFNSAGNATSGTVFLDSIGGVPLTVVGNGATINGTTITLPGTTNGNQSPASLSAYLDLPNGIVSSKTNLTFEFWVTPLSNRSWARLVDFGRMDRSGMGTGAALGEIRPDASSAPGTTQSWDHIMLTLSPNGAANSQQLEGRLDGGSALFSQTTRTVSTGTRYHVAMVFEDGVGNPSGGQLRWYLNGVLATSVDLPFKLQSLEDVNNWIGRSQYTADSMINASLDEIRIYDNAMSQAEVQASFNAGPNPAFSAPVAQPDSLTMHRGQKALIAVTANDTGPFAPPSVTITTPPQFGTAVPDSQGRVLYSSTSGQPTNDQFAYTVSGPGGTSQPGNVTVNFSNQLRLTPAGLNVPSSAPATTLAVVNAFSGLTFSQPVHITSPPGETRRLFICEKTGLVRVVPDVTATTPTATTFLNVGAMLSSRGESLATNSECGLLSVAFHPNFATNRQFFVFYSANRAGSLYQRVSRFTANATNPAIADPSSEQILIDQSDAADNHNGGDMAFGPDGYLYISTGDGGDQNDSQNNSQTITKNFFSSILRIDVDRRTGNLEPNANPAVVLGNGTARYRVPADNPYVGVTSFNNITIPTADRPKIRTEFWAVGLRNPWRMSFDPDTGDLYTGDVGGNAREEVNIITRGGNFGWAFREGTIAGPKTGTAVGAINPLYEYQHVGGNFGGYSITGGVFARNNRFALLNNAYYFADYVSGNIWSLRRNGGNVTVDRIAGEGGIVAFGRDPSNNDVLMANLNNGSIRRLVATTVTNSFPQTLSATGLFADLTDLSPTPGVLPYSVNRPFWSDFADKRRWFTLPDPAARFTWTNEGAWIAPAGAIWVKHFDIEMVRGNPASKKRLETRLLVRNSAGAYGVSYRWNDAGTEATLAPDEGVDFPLSITSNGSAIQQTWSIPSRASCISCHNAPAGHMLSFKTRQLNQDGPINGFQGNQIDLLASAGFFSNSLPPSNTLPRHTRPGEAGATTTSHVRSYLEANCAFCHMPGGTAPSNWDARELTPLSATGLINGIPNNTGGNPLNRLIVPGNTSLSVLLHRLAATGGFGRMPPIGSNVLDQATISQIQTWISSDLPARKDYAAWRVEKFGSTTSPAGDPNANPDGDPATNQAEFLIGTEPNSGTSFPNSSLNTDGNQITISLPVPANRIVWIETSTDLITWTRWNVPGNNALSGPAGIRTFTGPLTGSRQFFRPVVLED